MITARGLAERNDKTLRMARFADDEPVRSIQLYGTDPRSMGEAARFLAGDERADHIDLNFGCPVAKVTRKGGGRGAAGAPGAVPPDRAGRGAGGRRRAGHGQAAHRRRRRPAPPSSTPGASPSDEGAAAVALHARTAEQHYSGRADWRAIGRSPGRAVPTCPVLGNGDIWQAADALRMVDETGLRRRGRRPGLPGPAVAVRRPGPRLRRPGRTPRAAPRRGHRRAAPPRRHCWPSG